VTEQPVALNSFNIFGITPSQLAFTGIVLFEGQLVTVGAADAITVTVKSQLDPSVLLQVTMVVPAGNADPDAGVQVTVPHEPLVEGAVYVTVALHWPAAAVCEISPGQESVQMPGLVLTTVMLKLQVVLPEPSVAVQVTGVVPTEKAEPEGGTHPTTAQFPVALGAV
jgi:hypothetical protein